MPATLRIADPPRAIPPGLRLKLLAGPDVTRTPIYFVPAAVALISAAGFPTAPKIGLIVTGGGLLWLGLRTALPGLVRALRTLGRMRRGVLSQGRMVSCRPAWDGKRAEVPYAKFLSDWPDNVGKSQVGKATGCVYSIVIAVVVMPVVLMIVLAVGVLAMKLLDQPLGHAIAGEVDAPFLAQWIAMAACSTGIILLYLRFHRRRMMAALKRSLEERRPTPPGNDDQETGAPISLKRPLPKDYSLVELICRADYAVQGEPFTGEGRVRFCNRLDLTGVEPLLVDPARRETVTFLAELPEEARVDAGGQWEVLPTAGPAVALALTGLALAAALVGLGLHVPAIMALLR